MHREAPSPPTGFAQQGFLLAASPLPLLIPPSHLASNVPAGLLFLLAPLLVVVQIAGALLLRRRPLLARVLVTATVVGSLILIGIPLGQSPLGALGVFVAALGLLAWVWGWTLPGPARPDASRLARGSLWGAILVWLAALLAAPGTAWAWSACGLALLVFLFSVLAARGTTSPGQPGSHWTDFVFASPARTLVLSFVAVIAVGTVLLLLPHTAVGQISLLDALFTSTSATCVTGLVVRDTQTAFSPWGQATILLLIQVGGLGIMIFSVAGMSLTGRRLSLRQEIAALELVGTRDRSGVTGAARNVLVVTLVCETAGALSLALMFALAGDSPGTALWRGLFTSVSAFCNAGFALQSDNLMPYQQQAGVLVVVSVLIVLGGLGPAVIRALPAWVRRRTVPLQVRLVAWTTLLLLGPGALLLLAVEWSASLAGLGAGARCGNALLLAASPRTAGFNSVDMGTLRPVTLWLTMALMFVGGSPASTAGGIKTTTFALMTLMIHAALAGRTRIRVSGFQVSQESVYRAAAIAALALLTVVAVVSVIQLTQEMPLEMAAFESFSALGTVGLSIGGTARLDMVGKLVVVATMFAGRVGPLTLFMFLSARTASDLFELPEDDVAVG